VERDEPHLARSNSASMRRQNVSKAKSPPSNAVRRRR
jgi:hypothetical protein